MVSITKYSYIIAGIEQTKSEANTAMIDTTLGQPLDP